LPLPSNRVSGTTSPNAKLAIGGTGRSITIAPGTYTSEANNHEALDITRFLSAQRKLVPDDSSIELTTGGYGGATIMLNFYTSGTSGKCYTAILSVSSEYYPHVTSVAQGGVLPGGCLGFQLFANDGATNSKPDYTSITDGYIAVSQGGYDLRFINRGGEQLYVSWLVIGM